MSQKFKNIRRRNVHIEDIIEETLNVKTILFRDKFCQLAKPGQYVMIWIPGIDEIPMSISVRNRLSLSGVTVEQVGEATEELFKKTLGDIIGIRGPFGNWFQPNTGNVALVSGGTGIASLFPLIETLIKTSAKIVAVLGFKSLKEIIFLNRIRKLLSDKRYHRIIVTTEDGSYGQKGLATDVVSSLLKKETFKMIYTCGPELMMRRVFDLAEESRTHIQVCLERIIRCSVGLCGSCFIGEYRVCKEGLVLSSEQLRQVKDEFGTFKRDFNGVKMHFKTTH
ncbi:MAG: dihydroorotate dehydrogenase electron transfer subunit [Candidatus Bathyarchaeota archaeon]|nr:MAG: dihydroorotate dehydrogenase electron transfer subunit [Candidatus Bathyarchaeota archaeon]